MTEDTCSGKRCDLINQILKGTVYESYYCRTHKRHYYPNKPTDTMINPMTPTEQDKELDRILFLNGTLGMHPHDGACDCGKFFFADELIAIRDYITANYTQNTKVAERVRVAAINAQLGMIEYYDQVPNNKDMDWKELFSDNREHLEDELTKAKERSN